MTAIPPNFGGWIPDGIQLDAVCKSTTVRVASKTQKLKRCAVSMDEFLGTIKNGRGTNTCVANAESAALQVLQRMRGKYTEELSAEFLYWFGRKRYGVEDRDGGMRIKDGMAVLKTKGICLESLCPFDKDTLLETPSAAAVKDAKTRRLLRSRKLNSLQAVYNSLRDMRPVVFGLVCWSGLLSDHTTKTGEITIPVSGETKLGTHALLVTSCDGEGWFGGSMGWGADWGDNGKFRIHEDYLWDSRGLASKRAGDHYSLGHGGAF